MKLNEYITSELKTSREVSNVKYNHSFMDHNGAYHENGYKPKDKEALLELLQVLREERGDEGDYNDIDVSGITDMSHLFEDDSFTRFNGDITGWDTSKVKSMNSMFSNAESFNQPIGKWDVSKVEDMSHMFQDAKSFNQDLSNWKVHKVRKRDDQFKDCPIASDYEPRFA